MKRNHLLMALFALNIYRATATACGDGGDGSVPGCCYDQDGVCLSTCDSGYGLLNNNTKCGKCKDPKCAQCNGDVNKCGTYKQKSDPNCSDSDDVTGKCYDCAEGYLLSADGTCTKCEIANCSYCKSIKTCSSCTGGYGLVKGKCEKCSPKLNQCYSCNGDTSKCPKGKCLMSGYDKDGNYRFSSPKSGICTMCPIGVYSCFDDGFSCQSGYKSSGTNTCIKSSTDFSGDAASNATVGSDETTSVSSAVSSMASSIVIACSALIALVSV